VENPHERFRNERPAGDRPGPEDSHRLTKKKGKRGAPIRNRKSSTRKGIVVTSDKPTNAKFFREKEDLRERSTGKEGAASLVGERSVIQQGEMSLRQQQTRVGLLSCLQGTVKGCPTSTRSLGGGKPEEEEEREQES